MKRDIELVRELLIYIEDNCTYDPTRSESIEIDGYSEADIGYHLKIMVDGGLIEVMNATSAGSPTYRYFVRGMTWAGHEFLDSVRDDGVWGNVKTMIKPIQSASLDVVKNLAVAVIARQLGL